MSDLTKDDVRYVIQDAMHELKSDFSEMKDQVRRIDKRTDDLDASQDEVRELSKRIDHIYPKLEELIMADELIHMRQELREVSLRVQNMERGIGAITEYLQALQRTDGDTMTFRM